VTLGRALALVEAQLRARKDNRVTPRAALLRRGSGAEALLHRERTEQAADTMETPSAPPSRMGDTWQGVLLSGKGTIPCV
jgi:hypothetical protein